MKVSDMFLPRETKNLQKINEIAGRLNILMENDNCDVSEYSILGFEFNRIKTEEHKEKIAFYITMINSIIDRKLNK